MKIYLLSNKKLKIHFNRNDMEQMQLLYNDIDYKKEKTKSFIVDALNRANIETGFKTDNSKLLIETFPTFDKGVNIYITKLCESNSKWYIFKSLEHLLEFARKTSDSIPCSIYSYENQYILSVNMTDEIVSTLDLNIISEYAREISNDIKLWRMIEYSIEIIKDNPIKILKQIC